MRKAERARTFLLRSCVKCENNKNCLLFTIMKTPIENRDLNKQAPHSPRHRFGGFAILARTVDKCRASVNGNLGEFHYDCPLDNQLFSFKGVNGAQFKTAVETSQNYEDVADWLQKNGTWKTPEDIKNWSDRAEALKLKDVPSLKDGDHRKQVMLSCRKLGLDFETATLFEWLEADDQAMSKPDAELAASHGNN